MVLSTREKNVSKLKEGPISWSQAASIDSEYKLVLKREELGNELYVDKNGTIRWVANPEKEKEIMDEFGACDLNDLFGRCHADKNDPKIRELYKCIGYSLYGFWEVFYWRVNNSRASEYKGRLCNKPEVMKQVRYIVTIVVDEDADLELLEEALEEGVALAQEMTADDDGYAQFVVISSNLRDVE